MNQPRTDAAKPSSEEGRVYYSIADVSAKLGVKQHVLRYWEQEFDAVQPRRTARGTRQYRREDVDLLRRIKHLLWVDGYTIDGAGKRLENEHAGNAIPRNPEELIRQIDDIEQDLWRMLDVLNSDT